MPKSNHLEAKNVPTMVNLGGMTSYQELKNFKTASSVFLNKAHITSKVKDIGVKGRKIIPNKIFEQMCTRIIMDSINKKKLSE
jgi:hypothetical protein